MVWGSWDGAEGTTCVRGSVNECASRPFLVFFVCSLSSVSVVHPTFDAIALIVPGRPRRLDGHGDGLSAGRAGGRGHGRSTAVLLIWDVGNRSQICFCALCGAQLVQ